MTMRLSKSSLTGTERTLVAVGTSRLASMLAAVRAGAPLSGTRSTSPGPEGWGAADVDFGSVERPAGRAACGFFAGALLSAGFAAAGSAFFEEGAVPLSRRSAAPSPSSKNVTQVGSREAGSALYWSYISSTSHWFVPKSGVDGSCEDSATASIASSGWFPAHLDTVRLKTSALARTLDVRFALPGAVSPTVPRGDPRRTAIASIGAAEQGRCAGVRLPQATLTTTSDKPWNVASAAASWWSEDR